MSVRSETTKTSVSCVVAKASATLFIALNVHGWRRIGTDVRRLSTWEVRGQICSTRRKVSGINEIWLWLILSSAYNRLFLPQVALSPEVSQPYLPNVKQEILTGFLEGILCRLFTSAIVSMSWQDNIRDISCFRMLILKRAGCVGRWIIWLTHR
jgi:hypothetical protein